MKKAHGRKPKLTEALISEAEKYLSAGNFENTVAEMIGVAKGTWYRWKSEGETAKDGLKKDFYDRIKKATAKTEIICVAGILAAGKKNWQAFAWFLERKYSHWARKDNVEFTDDGSIKELLNAFKKSKDGK